MNERKLLLYIAASADGFIAAPEDDLSFLDQVYREGEDYGYAQFMEQVDTILLGRRTFDWLHLQKLFSYPGKRVIVLSQNPPPAETTAEFYSGNMADLVAQLRQQTGLHLFCDGGAQLIHSLLMENLVDELTISFIPVLLGDGIPLFRSGRSPQQLQLVSNRSFESGLVQLHYKLLKQSL